MTGVTITQFNNFFHNCYPQLVRVSQKIDNQLNNGNNVIHQYDYKDALHTAYMRIAKRLENNIFNGNISGYTSTVIRNVMIDFRKGHRRDIMEVEKNEMLLDAILRERQEEIESTAQYQDDIRELSKEIFTYLAARYDDKEIFIYRCYATTKGSTYKKIAAITNYSKSYVGEVVKKIKVDLRNNFIEYLKNKN